MNWKDKIYEDLTEAKTKKKNGLGGGKFKVRVPLSRVASIMKEGLKGGRYGGNPFSPKKSHVHGGVKKSHGFEGTSTTVRTIDGKRYMIRMKDGKEVGRIALSGK